MSFDKLRAPSFDKNGRKATIVVDLGYGDAGKGTIVDALVRKTGARTVIRHNGGAQALHRVVAPDGRAHVFSQFGSGTLVPGTRTHLSRYMVLSPLGMLEEDKILQGIGVSDAMARTTIDERALVITPFQRAGNRLRELARGDGRHGSCGLGVGETVSDSLRHPDDALRAGDLRDAAVIRRKLAAIREWKAEEFRDLIGRLADRAADETRIFHDGDLLERFIGAYGAFAGRARIVGPEVEHDLLAEPGEVVFEGAQGVLIDEWRGFHPYTTWSRCTFENALALLKENGYDGEVVRLGVVRAYGVRHGPGPFVTEDAWLTKLLPDAANDWNDWQRAFRVGWFDCLTIRYAIEVCGGVDALAVTCLDRLREIPFWSACNAYRWSDGKATAQLPTPEKKDLVRQERLTDALFTAKPSYVVTTAAEDFETRVEEHLKFIQAALNVPVRIASFGPAAGDKRFL